MILNLLNEVKYPIVEGSRIASTRPSSSAMPYYDTNADGLVTSLDALIVTNYLNGLLLQLGTGTTTTSFAALSASDEVPDPVSVLETPLYLPANSAQPLWSDSWDGEDEFDELIDLIAEAHGPQGEE